MYSIVTQKYITDQPWIKPLQQRLKELNQYKHEGYNIAMYLYEYPDNSTFRYRVYNISQALELSLEWKSVYFYKSELEIIKNYLDKISILILARFRWNFDVQKIIDQAKEMSIKIIFEVDDMIYNIEYLPIITNTLSVNMSNEADYDYWFAYISRMNATAKKCDAVLTTNDFLAEKMSKDLAVKSYVISNFTNRVQENISNAYYLQKQEQCSSGKFVIGYFSGTPSHINDFLVVAPELKKLLEKYQDITLRIVGFMTMPDYMHDLEQSGRIERLPLVNYLDLQAEIAKVDVNIAPLVNNDFSNCKSELKFFEASIVGTVTCATPSYTFRNAIIDGKNGYLCERGEWFGRLEELYKNRKHNNEELLSAAREYCIKMYSYFNKTTDIEETFQKILMDN